MALAARQVRYALMANAAQILVAMTLFAAKMVRFVQVTAPAVTARYALAGKFVQIADVAIVI